MSIERTAEQIVKGAIDAAGRAFGIDEVRAIAAKGPGDFYFTDGDMATLIAEYGSRSDALYAIQLEAQRRGRVQPVSRSELSVWARDAEVGEYLAHFSEVPAASDPLSRCGYSDAELSQVREWLAERGLSLETDDFGLRVMDNEEGERR